MNMAQHTANKPYWKPFIVLLFIQYPTETSKESDLISNEHLTKKNRVSYLVFLSYKRKNLERNSQYRACCVDTLDVRCRKREKQKWGYLISSNISGLSRSRCFILSFIAVMMLFALSSAPCLELFSAAPAIWNSLIRQEVFILTVL